VETLIRSGASVHVRDDYRTAIDQTHGYTPLHAAASAGNAEAVRVLLRHGANPADREDKYWGTPAGWANYFGRPEIRDIILEGPIDIFDAIAFDRIERIGEILTRDPLALDRQFGEHVTGDGEPKPWLDPKWTPLAFAVANGKLDAARILIERGADVTVRDSAERALVDIAKDKGHERSSALLEGVAALLRSRGG
jgi:ankyrin repeat protein